MATKKKTGTLKGAAQTAKKATKAVAKAADDYVVKPVEKALGMKAGKKKTAAKKSSSAKSGKTSSAKSRSTKSTSKAKGR